MVSNHTEGVTPADSRRDRPEEPDESFSADSRISGKLPLTKQAIEVIDEVNDAVDLVSRLDFSRYESADPYGASAKPFEPMFGAIFLQKLEDYTDTDLHKEIDENPETATALGFDPDDVPNRSTFYRAWHDRFEDLQSMIEVSAKQIRWVAAERGRPIGPTLTSDVDAEASNNSEDISKRTERRLIRRESQKVIQELESVVFPAIDLDRSEEVIYDDDELLTLESLLGLTDSAANEGGETYGDYINPDPELEDPFYEDGPTGETLLEAVKEFDPEGIATMINRAAARVLTRAKPHLEFERPVMLAIDITYVAYYGNREGLIRVQGAPDDKEYEWCHKFATANVVGDNVHFTVAMLPVGNAENHDPDAYPGKDKTYRSGGVVRNLLTIVEEQADLSARRVFADREFHAADVIAALEERGIYYVIPARRDDRVKRFVARMDDEVTVKENWGIYGPVKDSVTNERVETTLVGLPADEDRDTPQPFLTNLVVSDEIRLDRRETKQRIERYKRRGGIETAYKKIKEFGAWTTSKAFEVRLFHFGFAVLLYDMWLLVDFLVQVRLNVVEFRSKPRLTARRFKGFLNRRLMKLL
jgi:hypothetical protein